MRLKWLLAVAVPVVVLATLGGVALAAGPRQGEGQGPHPPDVLARAAEILGLDATTVKEAFAQARQEAQEQALRHRLERLVEKGRITQEQAEAILGWFQARPQAPGLHWPTPGWAKAADSSVVARAAEILGVDPQALMDALAQARREAQDWALQQRLKGLVEKGRITQEQADAILQWFQARPQGFGLGLLLPHPRPHQPHGPFPPPPPPPSGQ